MSGKKLKPQYQSMNQESEGTGIQSPVGLDINNQYSNKIKPSVFATEKHKSRKAHQVSNPNQVHIFENTALSQMPSITNTKAIKNTYTNHTSKSQLNNPTNMFKQRQEGDFGIVNYINGIPVSI